MNVATRNTKVVVVGDYGVGKTCLLDRFETNMFNAQATTTLSPAQRWVRVVNSYHREVSLEIWDTAGQEKYQAMAPMFYRNAIAAVLCAESLDETTIRKWVERVRAVCQSCVFVFAQTKCDTIPEDRCVEAQEQLAQLGVSEISHRYLTSAITGEGIRELFGFIADLDPKKVVTHEPPEVLGSDRNEQCSC
jgi:small GTP-binding protein